MCIACSSCKRPGSMGGETADFSDWGTMRSKCAPVLLYKISKRTESGASGMFNLVALWLRCSLLYGWHHIHSQFLPSRPGLWIRTLALGTMMLALLPGIQPECQMLLSSSSFHNEFELCHTPPNTFSFDWMKVTIISRRVRWPDSTPKRPLEMAWNKQFPFGSITSTVQPWAWSAGRTSVLILPAIGCVVGW